MDSKSSGYKSLTSIITNPTKDTIPIRLEFIKLLLSGEIGSGIRGEIKPMFDLDNTETENFVDIDDNHDTNDIYSSMNKKYVDFRRAIKQLGGALEYKKSGTYGHTFKGIISTDLGELNYAVKVVAFPKKERYGSLKDAKRPENAELRILKLLSYFVMKKQTPHLVLPLATFNTDIENFVHLIDGDYIKDTNDRYKKFVKGYKKGEYHDEVSILVSEWANKGDLLDYIRNNYREIPHKFWKVIFFQLLSVLAVIQDKYPQFRHNDLKANNVLLHKTNINKQVRRYCIAGEIYGVTNIGYEIKLWDFDFASIKGVIENAKVDEEWSTKLCNVTSQQNKYYDMHYFFNSLIRKGFFPQFMTHENIPVEAKDFINRIIPSKYKTGKYVHEKGRIMVNDEYTTPEQVLRTDPYFEEFRERGRKYLEELKSQQRIKNRKIKQKIMEDRRRYKSGIDTSVERESNYKKNAINILFNDDVLNEKGTLDGELSKLLK